MSLKVIKHPRFPFEEDSRKEPQHLLLHLIMGLLKGKRSFMLAHSSSRVAKDVCSATGIQLIKAAELPKRECILSTYRR
jgi:hypothetical protein